VLYVGVRNKFCLSCVFAARNNAEPQCKKRGTCAMNYQGPSTGMETSIVNEGFHVSEVMHGVRFHKLIGKKIVNSFITNLCSTVVSLEILCTL
jgi:hypothetical protein